MNVPDPLYILSKEETTFHSLLFTNNVDGEQLLAGTERGEIVSWDLRTGRVAQSTLASKEKSTCLALRFIDNTLLSQHKEGVIKLWSACNNKWAFEGEINLDYLGFCKSDTSFDSSGRAVIVCPNQKSDLEVYDVKTREPVATFRHADDAGKYGEIMACKVTHRNGEAFVIAAYESGHIAVWDVKVGNAVSVLNVAGKTDCPMAVDYDVERGRGICGSSSDTIVVFKLNDAMKLSVRHQFKMRSEGASCVRIRPDGKVFVVGCWDGKLRWFATKTCRPIAVVDYHASTILDLTFSTFPVEVRQSKALMAAADKDGKISLWDL